LTKSYVRFAVEFDFKDSKLSLQPDWCSFFCFIIFSSFSFIDNLFADVVQTFRFRRVAR